MNFIDMPNLPQKAVQTAIVDGRISKSMEKGFSEKGIRLIKTRKHCMVYEAVSFHPDIMLHHIGAEKIVYAPGTDAELLNELSSMGFGLIRGKTVLSAHYPGNIAYNVARVGSLAFHSLKYTDAVLAEELGKAGIELIHVNQGYAKCSTAVINERTIITADPGIAKAAEKKGIEVLKIHQDTGIMLPGLDKGFIGGCSGLIDKNSWAVAGNAGTLESFFTIKSFLKYKNMEIISLSNEKVVDIGSIIPILTE